jgi:GxxExxY protein
MDYPDFSALTPTIITIIMPEQFKYEALTHNIIGSAMEVHKVLGNGFQEVVYQRALAIELKLRNIPFQREMEMPLYYKGENVGSRRVDFFVDDKIMVELKATIQLDDTNLAQALNYLEAWNLETGLLINFGSRSLQFKRLLNKKYKTDRDCRE